MDANRIAFWKSHLSLTGGKETGKELVELCDLALAGLAAQGAEPVECVLRCDRCGTKQTIEIRRAAPPAASASLEASEEWKALQWMTNYYTGKVHAIATAVCCGKTLDEALEMYKGLPLNSPVVGDNGEDARDAARYRAKRRLDFESHTMEQSAVNNPRAHEETFNTHYDRAIDAARGEQLK